MGTSKIRLLFATLLQHYFSSSLSTPLNLKRHFGVRFLEMYRTLQLQIYSRISLVGVALRHFPEINGFIVERSWRSLACIRDLRLVL